MQIYGDKYIIFCVRGNVNLDYFEGSTCQIDDFFYYYYFFLGGAISYTVPLSRRQSTRPDQILDLLATSNTIVQTLTAPFMNIILQCLLDITLY